MHDRIMKTKKKVSLGGMRDVCWPIPDHSNIAKIDAMDHTSTVLHEDQDFVSTAFQLSHARIHVLDNVFVLS